MKSISNIFVGKNQLQSNASKVAGTQTVINGEVFYKISNIDAMRPFFMSIVSNSNHWLFISSNGGLSCGRKNSNYALFPYYTDDKITESNDHTGSKSIFLITRSGKTFLWEPFSYRQKGIYKTTRNLYKNAYGNKLIFEEINHDLEMVFSYQWSSCDPFGFVRKSTLKNNSNSLVDVRFLDGLQNILPHGVEDALQNSSSNLVDAYKKCELETDSGIGIYSLSAIIVDKAEPSEALKANIVWSLGLKSSKILLSSLQLDAFRQGQLPVQELEVKAERGAYFLTDEIALPPKHEQKWSIVANVNQTIDNIVALKQALKTPKSLEDEIDLSIEKGTKELISLVAASDGLQMTSDTARNTRHFANTMFNIMRGGIFDHNYKIEKADFCSYIQKANSLVYAQKIEILEALPVQFELSELKVIAEKDDDKNFKRLSLEYLPLKFSRRHGDPSRPWNKFSINTQSEIDGSKILDYQGNWRDIFQNWEALVHSYPEFIEGMIFKFLNATTFDGYNPYRVTKDGFDWEVIEPDNPWSYIGYWGDHQIIYLLKFLEFIEAHYPSHLEHYFKNDLFVYANVPYKIKDYTAILKDSKNTIDYDHKAAAEIQKRRDKIGVDGALLQASTAVIHKVNFIEKILATVLAKVSNLIPEAGIWMNTQRPEWNDANNALVGNGVSMVTLYYLRRFLKFFEGILDKTTLVEVEISSELLRFFNALFSSLQVHKPLLRGPISDLNRKTILDGLGTAASEYRNTVYGHSFLGHKDSITIEKILSFVKTTLEYLEHTIEANKREDDLFHAYNLMTVLDNDKISVSYLPEMLEGQVAVLSSGYLSTEAALKVLDGLKASALFRPDQYSYVLYPNKNLPRFMDKNSISAVQIQSSELLQRLLKDGNTQIISKDLKGDCHFNGNFKNKEYLSAALNSLTMAYQPMLEKETEVILDIYESIFDHKSFTGRSGTFFGYEGLGSIYWHMVSKLLLATLEVTQKAIESQLDSVSVGRLFDHYFEINAGIGAHKSPALYGAFPTDPYSHTPAGKGAQQPGMTGQVKEDILSRFGELGVRVKNGMLGFEPTVLKASEFLEETQTFEYYDSQQELQRLLVGRGCLAFTICQVAVVYKISKEASLLVEFTDSTAIKFEGIWLDQQTSKAIFMRANKVKKISVHILK